MAARLTASGARAASSTTSLALAAGSTRSSHSNVLCVHFLATRQEGAHADVALLRRTTSVSPSTGPAAQTPTLQTSMRATLASSLVSSSSLAPSSSSVASLAASQVGGTIQPPLSAPSSSSTAVRKAAASVTSATASPHEISSTVTVTPPATNTGAASTARPAALAADAPNSPFQPGSRWFGLVLTALIVGGLLALAAIFLLLKRTCIRRSSASGRWTKADEERALAMPWDPPAAAALERQHSTSPSAFSSGSGPAGSLESPPVAVLDLYTTAGRAQHEWLDNRLPGFQAFPPPPPPRHAYEDAYDADAAEVILPPSRAYLVHQAPAANGPYRPGEF